MWWQDILEAMKEARDPSKKKSMEAYMRNQFEFLGLQAGPRKEVARKFFKLGPRGKIDWDFLDYCWSVDYREVQYLGLDYLKARKKQLVYEDLFRLEKLIVEKSWWDTVDNFNQLISYIILNYPESKDDILGWSKDENIWLRRTAIIGQLKLGQSTDLKLLEAVIGNNLHSQEFFINKALGWALREYSKTDPAYVKEFLRSQSGLASLTIKEASKYLD